MITPRQLQELYLRGENITSFLKKESLSEENTQDTIEISYDLQAGSYIDAMSNEVVANHKRLYASEIAKVINTVCKPSSVLEAGVGEATTLAGVIKTFKDRSSINFYGFDLCWSRVAYAKDYLNKQVDAHTSLCTGSLFEIPFLDNSIDVVYTSHSIEPNGGFEAPILHELYRVARKYLILLEPSYEFANEDGKKRMELHGYCKNLGKVLESLGWNVQKHELFPHIINPLNPTAITIIEKENQKNDFQTVGKVFACPKFKTPLEKIGEAFFSHEGLCVYPILNGIPCLRRENSIIASHYPGVSQV